jgi:prevent-host-death family protein
MLMVNIADMKAKLSEYLEAASRGERVLICNRNKPIAELRAVEQPPAQARDLSPMFPGQVFLTDGFFEPMTSDDLREWYDTPVFPDAVAPTRAAETQPQYGKTVRAKKTRRK